MLTVISVSNVVIGFSSFSLPSLHSRALPAWGSGVGAGATGALLSPAALRTQWGEARIARRTGEAGSAVRQARCRSPGGRSPGGSSAAEAVCTLQPHAARSPRGRRRTRTPGRRGPALSFQGSLCRRQTGGIGRRDAKTCQPSPGFELQALTVG